MTPKRITLRVPPELHQLLSERARAEHRSLNSQIEYLLWQSFNLSVDAYARERGAIRVPSGAPKGALS